MSLIEKINLISEEAKNQFKPDLKKYGKNFRAISESAVLEVLNPLFKKYSIGYSVEVTDKSLTIEKVKAGLDASGNLIEKLVFVAECVVSLKVYQESSDMRLSSTYTTFEGWGSGVDSGDKATGKAITAAVKYALFKGFRLQYSDDPDADASEEIENIVKPAEREKKIHEAKTNDPLVSEAQLNYVKGLALACGISDEDFKAKYGYFPYDKNMPMRKARELIEELKKLQDEKLPF